MSICETMLYECHGHIFLDGADFAAARRRHAGGVDVSAVKAALGALRDAGVGYFRDGGDALGVSAAAAQIAPDYGIDYATPAFAIHKKGRYGSIVGKSYETAADYRALVAEAKAAGGGFIKLMLSGIITFARYGELSCPGLDAEEIRALVEIAHGEGLCVMAHVNGADTVRAAIAAGVDSIEHGYFMDEDCLRALADSGSIWVPTLAATSAFVGRAGFDAAAVEQTVAQQKRNIAAAAALGAVIASGSDAGASGVTHADGTQTEYRLLYAAGISEQQLLQGNAALRRRFGTGENHNI